jgi:hypothetical protein
MLVQSTRNSRALNKFRMSPVSQIWKVTLRRKVVPLSLDHVASRVTCNSDLSTYCHSSLVWCNLQCAVMQWWLGRPLSWLSCLRCWCDVILAWSWKATSKTHHGVLIAWLGSSALDKISMMAVNVVCSNSCESVKMSRSTSRYWYLVEIFDSLIVACVGQTCSTNAYVGHMTCFIMFTTSWLSPRILQSRIVIMSTCLSVHQSPVSNMWWSTLALRVVTTYYYRLCRLQCNFCTVATSAVIY